MEKQKLNPMEKTLDNIDKKLLICYKKTHVLPLKILQKKSFYPLLLFLLALKN
jgi:hypothetical protein